MTKPQKEADTVLSAATKARTAQLIIQETEKELLVYDLNTNRAICLNETSALVWKNCDGVNTAADIAKNIGDSTGHSVDEELVWFAIEQLDKENLLDGSEEIPQRFSGLSRRELIRKVGIGSMIALPIVSSLVAPQSFHAQTCVGVGANFAPGTVTASGATYPGGVCIPGDPFNICAGQGGNCCTGMATLTCHVPGTGPIPGAAPFSCACT
ncbi:MAG: PqqD family protein [Pyrinomonadaceae bacterium]|nr:PqqD family protein [Pyrinomonadaceae bacterium]